MCFGIWDQKRSSSWKKREILASFNGCLFQSQTPESNTEHCPGFVLSLAGCRLAMLTLAMWLCASAFRVAQWKRVWMLRTLRFINIRNETTKSTQIINVVILKNAFYFLDYAISLVRADWKGLDSLAAGRESAGCCWFVWMLEKLKAIHHRGYLQRTWIWHTSDIFFQLHVFKSQFATPYLSTVPVSLSQHDLCHFTHVQKCTYFLSPIQLRKKSVNV